MRVSLQIGVAAILMLGSGCTVPPHRAQTASDSSPVVVGSGAQDSTLAITGVTAGDPGPVPSRDSLIGWSLSQLRLVEGAASLPNWGGRLDTTLERTSPYDDSGDWGRCWSFETRDSRGRSRVRLVVDFFPPIPTPSEPLPLPPIDAEQQCRVGRVEVLLPVPSEEEGVSLLAALNVALDSVYGPRRAIVPKPTTVFGEFVDTTYRQRGSVYVLADLDRQQGHYDGEQKFVLLQAIGPSGSPLFPPQSHGNGTWPSAFSPAGKVGARVRWAGRLAGLPDSTVRNALGLLDSNQTYLSRPGVEAAKVYLEILGSSRNSDLRSRVASWILLSAVDASQFGGYEEVQGAPAESLAAVAPALPEGVPPVDVRMNGGAWVHAALDSAPDSELRDSAFAQLLRTAIPGDFDGECRGAGTYAASGAVSYLKSSPNGSLAWLAHAILFDVVADSLVTDYRARNPTTDARWRTIALEHLQAAVNSNRSGIGSPRRARAWRIAAGLPPLSQWYYCTPGE